MKKRIKVGLITILILFVFSIIFVAIGMSKKNVIEDIDRNGIPADCDVCSSEEYRLNMNVVSDTWGKYTAEITLANLTDHPIVNWMLYFDCEDELLTLDHGAIMTDQYGYRLCGDKFSESTSILAGESLTFTVTAKGKEQVLKDVQLSYRNDTISENEAVVNESEVSKPNGGTYEGENCSVKVSIGDPERNIINLEITNTSDEVLNNWIFLFPLPGRFSCVVDELMVDDSCKEYQAFYNLDGEVLNPGESKLIQYWNGCDLLPTEFCLGNITWSEDANGCPVGYYYGLLRSEGGVCITLVNDEPEEYTTVLDWDFSYELKSNINIAYSSTDNYTLSDEDNEYYNLDIVLDNGGVISICTGILSEDAVMNFHVSRRTYYKNGSYGVNEDGFPCVRNQAIIMVSSDLITQDKLEEYLEDYNATIVGKNSFSYQIEFSETVTKEEVEAYIEILEKEEWVESVYPNLIMNDGPCVEQ